MVVLVEVDSRVFEEKRPRTPFEEMSAKIASLTIHENKGVEKGRKRKGLRKQCKKLVG